MIYKMAIYNKIKFIHQTKYKKFRKQKTTAIQHIYK